MAFNVTVSSDQATLGVGAGVGLVVANTVGIGVLTNAGYMAAKLGPWEILLAWVVGGVMALAGAHSYAAIAAAIPRSGGEYRYLSDLAHPFLGTLAGWTSLLVGFSAPVALAAAGAGSFVATIVPSVSPSLVAAVLIVGAALSQALDLRLSRATQDAFALLKVVLLFGFIAVGLVLGSHVVPVWQPLESAHSFPVRPFAVSLVYIAYAFSGWNTVVYAAGQFREPRRTVPRAMLLGTTLIAIVYLLVNWLFVANLNAETLALALRDEASRITLVHVLIEHLAGRPSALFASLLVVVCLWSSMVSMMMVGPRVAAAMAAEGFLPRVFVGSDAKPPRGSVMLQCCLSLALLLTHSFELLLTSVGAILTLTSALTVAGLFGRQFARGSFARPSPFVLASAAIYGIGSIWILWFTLLDNAHTWLWGIVIGVTSAIAYLLARRRELSAYQRGA